MRLDFARICRNGKTTSVGAVVRTLRKSPACVLGPHGPGAKVLAKHAGQPASTIHRHIYRPRAPLTAARATG